MNIKFLFDYIESSKNIVENDIEEIYGDGYDDTDYQAGYLQALHDFESYLKSCIELTKTPKTIHGTELGVWGNPANSNSSLPLDLTTEELKKIILESKIEFPKEQTPLHIPPSHHTECHSKRCCGECFEKYND